jgi:hypothetical protein
MFQGTSTTRASDCLFIVKKRSGAGPRKVFDTATRASVRLPPLHGSVRFLLNSRSMATRLIALPAVPHRSAPRNRARHRPATIVTIAAGALLALAGCARKDFSSEMGRARSWTATTNLARERRELGATNRAVTSQLLQRAEKAHSRAQVELAKLASSDSERVAARGVLDSLQDGILRLQRVTR